MIPQPKKSIMRMFPTLWLPGQPLPGAMGFAPGYPCCCGGGCVFCDDFCDEGTMPSQLEVTLSGVVNAAFCSDCDDLNDTWILDCVGREIGTCNIAYCGYWHLLESSICGVNGILCLFETGIGAPLADFKLVIHFTDQTEPTCVSSVLIFKSDTITIPLSCSSTFNETSGPFIGLECNISGATCTVTGV